MKNEIVIKGASEHNLKNLNVTIPRNKLIVFTGVSGSGKSSLAFDTLYAEGQRRYVESLSSYARQFLGQMEKPKVDYIEGLSPAISIEQKSTSKNPRSTVGTVTEIYDYLRVLYARIGEQFCHKCGGQVSSQSIDQIVDNILNLNEKGTKIQILAPIVQNRKGEHKDELEKAKNEGFVRARINGITKELNEDIILDKKSKHNIDIVVDRLIIKPSIKSRLTDSVETSLKLTKGFLKINYIQDNRDEFISEVNSCPKCNISFPELTPQHFSFNSPIGMCHTCNGLGSKMEVDPQKIIDDESLSIMTGVIIPWGKLSSKKNNWTIVKLKALAKELNVSLYTPWKDYGNKTKKIFLYGLKNKKLKVKMDSGLEFNGKYEGIINTIERRIQETVSEDMRKYYMKFLSEKLCSNCNGDKLREESLAVKIQNKTINEITAMSIKKAKDFFFNIKLEGNKSIIATDILKEIIERLDFLNNVGLHYLNLDRKSPTLSGGESQRIRLASQIGSGLVGVMYILDEPSIGLHQKDNTKLINMLIKLKNLGNTIIVVEHDEEIMHAADMIIDFGPKAGIYGGEIIAQGTPKQIINNKNSLTGAYLSKRKTIEIPNKRIKENSKYISIINASHNNLKNINVDIPIGVFTCITGVSGSGKSSLINQTLFPAVSNLFNRSNLDVGKHDKILGLENIDKIIAIDQQPIGRTPRSNPATYVKLFDPIRKLFSELPASKLKGYTSGRFSFNVKGGRCEACQGAGIKQVQMHFLPDIFVNCEVCGGKRYNNETLTVKFKEKNISEVLNMDVQEALNHFENIPSVKRKLQTLHEVGLDYIKLGQSSTTLSGGEAQRIKLSRELSKTSTGKTLYILDEPTTGLHFEDIKALLKVLKKLVDMGNTVIVIEHNLDIIKNADYIIDLGPEGGSGGGEIIAKGTPEEIINIKNSFTGNYLKPYLNDKK